MKNITISDIAAKAGVSKATVSRVLNSPGMVEENTRKRIEQIMKETHYSPSAMARNLSKQASSTVGVIVPEIGNHFFGDLFRGIEEIINDNHLSLLYCSNEDDPDKDILALDLMKMQRVRGVVYVPAVNYPAVGRRREIQKKLDSLGCPVICADRDIGLHSDTIHFEDQEAVRLAVLTLVDAGHKKIAFINGSREKNILAEERYAGYLAGLNERRLSLDKSIIFQGEYTQSYAYGVVSKLMKRNRRPTAIITCNNSLGRGYLQALYEAGTPELFTHVGLDQTEMLDILGIAHNYVKRDSYEMGRRAAEMLISRIAFPEKGIRNIKMEAPLVRETY